MRVLEGRTQSPGPPRRIDSKNLYKKSVSWNEKICKDTRSLGAGYQIGHSFFCGDSLQTDHDEWYRQLVNYELKPLLEEYWMDDPDKVAFEGGNAY